MVSSDGKTILVHRTILIARSSVFAAMFASGGTEVSSRRCIIKDIDYDTLNVLMQFLYYWSTEKIVQKNAENVLIAADKYNVEALKQVSANRRPPPIMVGDAFGLLFGLAALDHNMLLYIIRLWSESQRQALWSRKAVRGTSENVSMQIRATYVAPDERWFTCLLSHPFDSHSPKLLPERLWLRK